MIRDIDPTFDELITARPVDVSTRHPSDVCDCASGRRPLEVNSIRFCEAIVAYGISLGNKLPLAELEHILDLVIATIGAYVCTGLAKSKIQPRTDHLPILHRSAQSVGATGGVYKGQGRNQCKLMTCAY